MSWLRFDGADHLRSWRELLEREGWGEGRLGAELPPGPPCLLASLSALPLILIFKPFIPFDFRSTYVHCLDKH